jgi:hypothetical protein
MGNPGKAHHQDRSHLNVKPARSVRSWTWENFAFALSRDGRRPQISRFNGINAASTTFMI